jgi:hypothetical protein
MPNNKKPLNQATIEDLKINHISGITNSRYEIYIYVPNGWLESAVEGTGVSANFINQTNLRDMVFYAGSVGVEKINKTNVLIRLETSEPYIVAVHSAAQQVPDDAELKLSATKTKE